MIAVLLAFALWSPHIHYRYYQCFADKSPTIQTTAGASCTEITVHLLARFPKALTPDG